MNPTTQNTDVDTTIAPKAKETYAHDKKALQAHRSTTDTNSEANALLNATYTMTEVSETCSTKANQIATYTKTEVNATSTTYTKTIE